MLSAAVITASLALVAGTANADHHRAHRVRPAPPPIERALWAAASYWGVATPCGTPTARWTTPSGAPSVTPQGWVEWINGRDADCVVHLNPYAFPYPAAMFAWLCRVVTHEYGHLLGLGHTTDPHDVMFGGTAGWLAQIPQCGATP